MYQCQTVNCGYIYNPDKGDRKGKIPKGTLFEDLPDDWKCPVCGARMRRRELPVHYAIEPDPFIPYADSA